MLPAKQPILALREVTRKAKDLVRKAWQLAHGELCLSFLVPKNCHARRNMATQVDVPQTLPCRTKSSVGTNTEPPMPKPQSKNVSLQARTPRWNFAVLLTLCFWKGQRYLAPKCCTSHTVK